MSVSCEVWRFRNGAWETVADAVSRETALHIEWVFPAAERSGRLTLWAWPGPSEAALGELALGHVLTDVLPAVLGNPLAGQQATGEVVGSFEAGFTVRVMPCAPRRFVPVGPLPAPELVLARMDAFIAAPGKWDGTGCFHRAGLYLPSPWAVPGMEAAGSPDSAGEDSPQLLLAEDIGRHNCLDRLAGYLAAHPAYRAGEACPATLFVSARVTASLYAKIRRIGFTDIVSRSAVTLQAVTEARREGVRLIGFARPREGRFTLFAGE